MDLNNLRSFIRLARPWLVISTALLYALGAGIAHYLGTEIDWRLYWLGQGWVSLIQLSTFFLVDYFANPMLTLPPSQSPISESTGALSAGGLPREVALWSGLVCLTMAGSLSVLLINITRFNPQIVLVMLVLFIIALLYAIPPVRLIATGYSELTIAVLAANLVPTMSFMLQYGELHRLLAMTTFPLTALSLAMLLAFELPGYATDLKLSRKNIMLLLGWERGMQLHNLLILLAFVLVGISSLIGLPWRIALPVSLALPLGIAQILMMRNIAEGGKPNWRILTILATASFSVAAYLFLYAYWTN